MCSHPVKTHGKVRLMMSATKVELCALPQAIYNTYRRILPKKKDAVVMPEEDALATTEEEKSSLMEC